MTRRFYPDESIWRPQSGFLANIASRKQLQSFNDSGGIAVAFDVMRATSPEIQISGSQEDGIALWHTHSPSGFVSQPKFNANLITMRFVTGGHVLYRHQGGDFLGAPTFATLIGFDGIRQMEAAPGFTAVSATILVATLLRAQRALTGDDTAQLPHLKPIAEVESPGMKALACTVTQIHRRMQVAGRHGDLVLPLLEEIMSYQLLSAWPVRSPREAAPLTTPSPRYLRLALNYIEANLTNPLTLSEIAAVAGVSVRTLQLAFHREVGQAPTQFIIGRRLERARRDLLDIRDLDVPIAELAKRWGFAHASDFGQRYRRQFGCTPSETRRQGREAAGRRFDATTE
ncbi:helix-turn-helix domain-containing protein [Methylobacterium isbiliense]|jgi:AraC-like DNA-binding protein|uniref:HTH-type transcriptional activator RhaS n=1 Tax=Methylobacterium isbiliense TaxID=315478 RepID=A0ABQ4SCD0_9HYPH|nr:AraC family transcriptional regulator [Methylobacterium isbiliense]MDN3621652.1 AraC family transcriptional regulator [Methylobacterium isbiliense]GJE00704.1 HTH-type transcriptional activator RhaS [Methylobacterium isbiliense]